MLLTKQMKTSTVGLNFLYVTEERALLSRKPVRKGSARKHCWKERTRTSAAAGGSESTSSSYLLGRQAPWKEASFSDPFSISPSGLRPPSSRAPPLSQPVDSVQHRPEQMTPASCLCLQSCCPHSLEGHLHTWDSFPMQFRSSSQMGPDPAPKWADPVALRASPQPSCLHTTRASSRSQRSSQMVPQEPWSRISTLPAQRPPPSTRRSCLLSEEREMGQWGGDPRGWEGSSALWDPYLSSRGRSPLRP